MLIFVYLPYCLPYSETPAVYCLDVPGRGTRAGLSGNWVTYDTVSYPLRFSSLGREQAGHSNQMEFPAGKWRFVAFLQSLMYNVFDC